MIDDETVLLVKQKRLDSLAAKHLHLKSLARLRRLNRAVDFLGMAVPILFFPVRYIAKGAEWAIAVEWIWEFLAATLLVLVILKMAYGWQERSEVHSRLLGENIGLVALADNLLLRGGRAHEDGANVFLALAERSEKADREALPDTSQKSRQFAYREALKESEPGNHAIVCPGCKSSPWRFARGSCQMCGNTPVANKGN